MARWLHSKCQSLGCQWRVIESKTRELQRLYAEIVVPVRVLGCDLSKKVDI
jgi:hypothetical protein